MTKCDKGVMLLVIIVMLAFGIALEILYLMGIIYPPQTKSSELSASTITSDSIPYADDIDTSAFVSPEIKKNKTVNNKKDVYTTKKQETDETVEESKKPVNAPITEYDEAAIYIAKTLYGECRGCSKTQQAAVVWCILNRVDAGSSQDGDAVIKVVTKKSQFLGYSSNNPVKDDLLDITLDVIQRWQNEKNGIEHVGRVLPKDYLWFAGNGKINIFRNKYNGGTKWDFSWGNPYGE